MECRYHKDLHLERPTTIAEANGNLTVIWQHFIGVQKLGKWDTVLRIENKDGPTIFIPPRCKITTQKVTKALIGLSAQDIARRRREMSMFNAITHEVQLTTSSIHTSCNDIDRPGQAVAIFASLGAAAVIERPSNSSVILTDDKAFAVVTWTDILGSKHKKLNSPRRIRNNKLIIFLKELEDWKANLLYEASTARGSLS